MKHLLKYILIVGISLYGQTILSQSVCNVDSMQSIITLKLSQDSIEVFLANVRTLELGIIKDESINYEDHLELLDSLYEIPLSKQVDSFLYRTYLCKHAVKIKNITNDYVHALDYYLLAYAYAKDKTELDNYGWYNEKHIANNYARLNQYDQAIFFYKKCIPYLEKNAKFKNLSRLYSDLGNAYKWMNDHTNMVKYYDLAIEYGIKSKSYIGLHMVHLNYAIFHREQASKSLNVNEQLISKHLEQSTSYLEYAKDDPMYPILKMDIITEEFNFLNSTGNQLKANEKLNELLAISDRAYVTKRSRERAKRKQIAINYYLQQDELITANRYFKKAFKDLLPDYSFNELPNENILLQENTFADLLSFKSDYYKLLYKKSQNENHLDSALLSINLALDSKRSLDDYLNTNETKRASISTNKKLVDKALEVCYLKHQISDSEIFHKRIRTYFDQSKSLIFLQESSNTNLSAEIKNKDQIALDSINENLIQLYISSDSKNEKNIFENIKNRNKIYEKYKKEYPTYKAIDQNYIEYVATEKAYYLFTNMNSDFFIRLGDKNVIDSLISNVIQEIESKSELKTSKNLIALSKILIPFTLKERTELTFIPDGILAYLPFDIMLQNDEFLIYNHQISIEPHHKKIKRERDHESLKGVYCLAPIYENQLSYRNQKPNNNATRSKVTVLPFVESEINSIRDEFGHDVTISRDFDLSELIEHSGSAKIFHFSGHARASQDSSYLILDNDKTIFDYNQVSSLKNNFDLVVLSACETGLGQFDYGEGLRSLSSAFLNAGSKSIIYTLWKVNDQSSAQIISNFYKNLNDGMSKSTSLHKAKLSFLEEVSPSFKHPYYWAGITLVGNNKINKGLKLSSKVMICGTLFFLLLIIKKTR